MYPRRIVEIKRVTYRVIPCEKFEFISIKNIAEVSKNSFRALSHLN